MASPQSVAISGLREFFARNEKDKLSADLRSALLLLQLDDLDALEERFLATNAFLKPWSIFRDSILLLWPDAMPRATWIKTTASEGGISRMDVLWFYTRFDEGTMRYDARADEYSPEYTPDSSEYGVIDKTGWSMETHEKHMYAWLLQEFKIGKAHNVWGFKYFELQSAAKAWETVFVPIINAVRASYDIKGRRFYGRLALFVESRCPSRLAFPENNVGATKSELLSPTPFRIVSMPKKPAGSNEAALARRLNGPSMLTRKHYDETEKELREVYPQYGGLVERPKFKIKMEEWLAEQRVRADARKALQTQGEVRSFQPQIVQYDGKRSQSNTGWPNCRHGMSHDVEISSIKRTFNNIRRSISSTVLQRDSKELPKSPLHGVTRQLHFPDDDPASRPESVQEARPSLEPEVFTSPDSSDTDIVTPWPRPEKIRQPSEYSVYTSIRNANPFTEDLPDYVKTQQSAAPMEHAELQPTDEPSSILRLLQDEADNTKQSTTVSLPKPVMHPHKHHADLRLPSYEGNGYADEISLTKLHANRNESTRTPRPTRLPIPIKPTPYSGPLHVMHHEPAARSMPKKIAWPGFEDDDVYRPAVPAKSPERLNKTRRQASEPQSGKAAHDESRSITRIVSKANIRAAIGDVSREGSTEDLVPPVPVLYADGPTRTASPGGSKLHTYNTHLFPRKERKDAALGSRVNAKGQRYETGGQYEMEVLKGNGHGPEAEKF
ncbi:hypothetical protein J1614_001225 [Plenodomus biglobosus]|nr:hypothetical protein J1614_001225 [Plenodomus biglobosus]